MRKSQFRLFKVCVYAMPFSSRFGLDVLHHGNQGNKQDNNFLFLYIMKFAVCRVRKTYNQKEQKR